MVSAVNNPNTGFTGFTNDVINGGGQLGQAANSANASFETQQIANQAAGGGKALEAQQEAMVTMDKNQAALIGLQGKAMQDKQMLDVANAIQSGKEDSSNKKISATAQNAKGINY